VTRPANRPEQARQAVKRRNAARVRARDKGHGGADEELLARLGWWARQAGSTYERTYGRPEAAVRGFSGLTPAAAVSGSATATQTKSRGGGCRSRAATAQLGIAEKRRGGCDMEGTRRQRRRTQNARSHGTLSSSRSGAATGDLVIIENRQS
jgi:hypothetical protein